VCRGDEAIEQFPGRVLAGVCVLLERGGMEEIMQSTDNPRTYSGTPGEQVTVTTTVRGSGSARFELNGQDMGSTSPLVFNLPGSAGQSSVLSVTLIAGVGDSCDVDVAVVDGGSDRDLLKAQPLAPFPVHKYTFNT
jgi:hypothetical protein